ncbi:MAG: hypothetical protein ACMUJM_05165 [bacterium]
MPKNKVFKNIVLIESIGFLIVILFLWMDEIFDIPHILFGYESTPINVAESIYETIIVLSLGIVVIGITLYLFKKIRRLEGFLVVCAFCKKIRVRGKWIPIEIYIKEHSDAECSHSFCPECGAKHYGVQYDDDD